MTNIMPVLQMLGLSASDGTPEVIEAIRRLQRSVQRQKERADAMEENWKTEHARVRRAENPENWRATFTGDAASMGTLFTCLTHGNLVEINGTGQVLMHFHPCCQNLRCDCTKLDKDGHCACHKNDE